MQLNKKKRYGLVFCIGLVLSCAYQQTTNAWGPLSVGLVGVGTFSGCYAIHLTFKSEKSFGNKLCSLAKAGCLGTISATCLIGGWITQ